MIILRPGSYVMKMVSLLSIVGEFPMCSLYLVGNERVLKSLIHKLEIVQCYRVSQQKTIFTCKLLHICGKGKNKSVRFYKAGLSLLKILNIHAYQYYMQSFWNHRFPGDAAHRDRNHRVAESLAMMMEAGIKCVPYQLPPLQNTSICKTIPEYPTCYLSKNIKKISNLSEMNKTMFTRAVSIFYSDSKAYVVYNTRDTVMKWNGMGEFKTLHSFMEVSRLNTNIQTIDSAILFGRSEETALKTLKEVNKNHRLEFRFDQIYRHIYFIPISQFGIRILRLFCIPNWKHKLINILFRPESLSNGLGIAEYDAYINETYIYSSLDYDIARLIRLKESIKLNCEKYEIICFPEQLDFLREYLGVDIVFKTITLTAVERAMGVIN